MKTSNRRLFQGRPASTVLRGLPECWIRATARLTEPPFKDRRNLGMAAQSHVERRGTLPLLRKEV